MFPFLARNDPRNQIERKDSLGSFQVVVDGKGHSLREKGVVCKVALLLKILARHPRIASQQLLIVLTDAARRIEHLVEVGFGRVSLKKIPHKLIS
jgi:hypothetical protein